MSSAVLLYITCPDAATATAIGRSLVAERLVACVNLLPGMHSIYRWQGAIEEADEVVLLAKTRTELTGPVTAHVRGQHPYQEPCIVALPITGGSPSFLAWIAAETQAERS
jgi:periplasmic divalent cation tolerance protein